MHFWCWQHPDQAVPESITQRGRVRAEVKCKSAERTRALLRVGRGIRNPVRRWKLLIHHCLLTHHG